MSMATHVPCLYSIGLPAFPSVTGTKTGSQSTSSSASTVGLFARVSICTSIRCAFLLFLILDRILVDAAGRELAVHAGRADADALLAARHAQAVELRAVEQLGEDLRNLRPHDAGAVVRHADAEAVVGDLLDVHADLRQDARLLARVERVVHRLLHAGQQRLARAVEAQQVPVLQEEFGDGDFALFLRHALRRFHGRFVLVVLGHESPSEKWV